MKLLLLIVLCWCSSQSHAVTVTSLNIKWYGRGGDISGDASSEYRNKTIKDFVKSFLPTSDVIVFQEITDPEMLMDVFKELDCFTYSMKSSRHQYVVMCAKEGALKSFEVNHDVRLGKNGLRAALVGNFEFKDQSKLKVVGLHLKAGPEDTRTRVAQIIQLQPSLVEDVPTLVIGDVNTYEKTRTKLDKDDSVLINEKLIGFDEALNSLPTYMGFGGKVFDRAWGRGLKDLKVKVYGPCGESSDDALYTMRDYYRYFVSDHCALQVKFEVEK